MVTWPKASSTPSLAIMRLARASCSRASSSLIRHGHFPFRNFFWSIIAFIAFGDQPFGASSKPSKEKPGATVQPTSVQSPKDSAACQARAGTVTCGTSSAWMSAPSRMISSLAPSTISSLSGAPA